MVAMSVEGGHVPFELRGTALANCFAPPEEGHPPDLHPREGPETRTPNSAPRTAQDVPVGTPQNVGIGSGGSKIHSNGFLRWSSFSVHSLTAMSHSHSSGLNMVYPEPTSLKRPIGPYPSIARVLTVAHMQVCKESIIHLSTPGGTCWLPPACICSTGA